MVINKIGNEKTIEKINQNDIGNEHNREKSIKFQIIQRGKWIFFSTDGSGTIQYQMVKKTHQIWPQPFKKINSKCIINLNVKVKNL